MPIKQTIYGCSYGCGYRRDQEQEMIEHERECCYRPENIARSVWQPMATAPKDGTFVLLLVSSSDGYAIEVGKWGQTPACFGWEINGCFAPHISPVNWLYIPPLPEEK